MNKFIFTMIILFKSTFYTFKITFIVNLKRGLSA
ncbi:hypothetical protein CWQ_02590 [Buchnera aphidicola str. TLW03 (Acyrthosiphon pisum)]|nr:hypothetical protein CWO_02560 [Buchnera aphidicola str. LL01 (Acyrthosiphon pisum)]ADP66866.1 hypothetical protein CWQ_02590 [Buchnera aphidicola str. TLW03 (Acyrthosiphon pisum)]ADP67949.1 hypothetical protein CWU_03175 [Buchnera aphidicola str. JF98 (Acyrthosiphon pisum)]